MKHELLDALSFLKRWFLILWKFFVGGIVVLIAFLSNFIDLKRPNISLEIIGIEQIMPQSVDVTASPEFTSLRKLVGAFAGNQYRCSAHEMEQVIERNKQSILDRKRELDKMKIKFGKMPMGKEINCLQIGQYFNPYIAIDISNMDYGNAKCFVEKYLLAIGESETLLQEAANEVKSYIERTEKSEAKIVVRAAVTNSGDGSTTLKPQALLRTDLGQGNYLDINLKVSSGLYGYDNFMSTEIKARGSNVIQLESQSINTMAQAEQERFLKFLGNTSPTNLYLCDVRGVYYKSNTIPFAQGIYEQKLYDGLKAFASKK
jgi:hypothetical protein